MATLVTPRALFQFQVGPAPTLGFTALKTTTVRGITVANVTALSVTAFLWKVPPAGSPDDTNVEVPGVVVAARGMLNGDGVMVLEAGWEFWAMGDGLTVTGDGATSEVV